MTFVNPAFQNGFLFLWDKKITEVNREKENCELWEKIFRKSEDNIYPKKILANQLITIDDLQQFKNQLLEELLIALKSQTSVAPKRWMKTHEVRKLLKISPGTLQTLIFRCYSLYKNRRRTFL